MRKTSWILSILLIGTLVNLSVCRKQGVGPDSEKPRIRDPFLASQLQAALVTFDRMRNSLGVYADAVRFDGAPVPCSIASVGMGLVALCVADALGLDPEAESKALQTLRAFLGKIPGFLPARHPVNGFFRHWIDMRTGDRAWNSEYSTIDTGILISGGFFCKAYFSRNGEIARLADSLYLSVRWADAIGDPERGEIWMVFDDTGKGQLPALPFNEYMIVAWLALNDIRNNARAIALWSRHYADPASLPKRPYAGYTLLTDGDHYLSHFVIQFPFYLCHAFTMNPAYTDYLIQAAAADRAWWRHHTNQPTWIWGTGAGPSLSGYQADQFENNGDMICSPHIVAGFLPVYPEGLDDLKKLWESGLGRYTLPGTGTQILWRFSLRFPVWRADGVAGVDWSTMVFGLAAHPAALGIEFFRRYNAFLFPDVRMRE